MDAPEDIRAAGYANGKPSVLIFILRQPNANIIDTVDGIRAVLPQLKAAIPQSIDMRVAMDQTLTIRASVDNVEQTLIISVILVILVVFLFLRNPRTTFIPSIAVPVSLIGTFGVMYLLGYSLDNLSLMALCISTGFVVDDAIVVIENISRYLEKGLHPFQAALTGAKEIGSTVLTISISLVAVFIPLLLMGGIVGRLFREFAVTLAVAITRLHGRFAHRHSHDVRSPVERTRVPWLAVPEKRARLQRGGEGVWENTLQSASLSGNYAGCVAGHHCAQRLPLHLRAQGILPATG